MQVVAGWSLQVVAVVAAWSLQLVAAWSLELVAGWSLQLVAGWSLGKGLLIDAVLVVLVGEARCAVIHLAPLQNSLQVAETLLQKTLSQSRKN